MLEYREFNRVISPNHFRKERFSAAGKPSTETVTHETFMVNEQEWSVNLPCIGAYSALDNRPLRAWYSNK
jgi:hypothetical protein